MKVILTEYVYKHGVAGEVVTVADGFARNFLLPRKLAVKATPANLEKLGDLRAKADQNRLALNDQLSAAARQIDGVELVFGAKAGNNNKLYGSITTQMIAEALREKSGVDINRRRISERTLRELGRYRVPVRMGTDQSPVLNIVILREEEVAPYLAGQMAPPPLIEHVEEEANEPIAETVEAVDTSTPAGE
jgi:large subunit ribosomal protein L9